MFKIYKMPNGIKRQYEEGKAPKGAVLVTVEKKAESIVKVAKEPANKAISAPKNKVKGSRKK